jgi:hypothetical protein
VIRPTTSGPLSANFRNTVSSERHFWAAARPPAAIERVAIGLAEPDQHILPAREPLRPRP